VCLAQQGKYTEAEPMLQAVLTSSRRIFGPNHIRTIEVGEDLDMLRTIHPVERGEERSRLRAKADAKKPQKPVAKMAPSAEAKVRARAAEEELPAILDMLEEAGAGAVSGSARGKAKGKAKGKASTRCETRRKSASGSPK
jgi:hypothetical protein